MRRDALLMLLCAMAACSSSPGSAPSSSPATQPTPVPSSTVTETVATIPVPPAIDPNDPDPIVTFGYRPYGETEYWPPHDLQQIYLYPNGSVVQVLLGGDDSDGDRPLQLYRFDIDLDDLIKVVSRAEAAGLVGGGMQQLVPLPPGAQVVDGGQAVFTAKRDGLQTARIVDQLVSDPSFNRDGERATYTQLYFAIMAVGGGTDRDSQPFDRWVIVSAPIDPAEPDDDASTWTGPDIDTINWHPIDNGAKCAIVENAEWPITRDEREDWKLVIDQQHITRRPLLPHESTCAEVADWRSLLDL
jgi:hypothetical protein